MAKASANLFPYLHLVPAAAPASPAAGSQRLYLDSADGNKLKRKDSSGAVTTVEGGGGGSGDASWTNATLAGSWVTFGGSYPTPGFRKDASGVVHLRGVIKSGTTGTTAFTLPSGYRPTAKASFVPLNSGASPQLDVNSDGTVVPSVASTTYVGLDGVSFYID